MTACFICEGEGMSDGPTNNYFFDLTGDIYRHMSAAVEKLLYAYWPGDYAVENGAISCRETREEHKIVATYYLRGRPIFYSEVWFEEYALHWKVAEIPPEPY